MFRISFDFDAETQTVSNIQVENSTAKYESINLALVEVADAKLLFSKQAVELLSAKTGDRIAVNYVQKNNECTFPVIGKAEVFTDPSAGNLLTRINTMSFKGAQKATLLRYGQSFRLEPYKDGMFKMIPIDDLEICAADSELIDENNELNLI